MDKVGLTRIKVVYILGVTRLYMTVFESPFVVYNKISSFATNIRKLVDMPSVQYTMYT